MLDRLASRAQTFGADDEIRPDDLRRRLAGRLDPPADAAGSIHERLAQAGISASTAGAFASADDLDPDDYRAGDPDLTVAHVYSLEVVRYLLLAAVVTAGAASAWFLMRAVGVNELVDGNIAPDNVEQLDVARRIAVSALGGALAIVPLWCAFAAIWTRRVGVELVGVGRCLVLFLLAASINVVTFVFDGERSTLSLIGTLVCLGAALWSIPVMISVQRTFVRSTTVSSFLPVTLAFVTVTSWIGGFQSPVVPGDSVEMLSFFGGLQLVVLAVALIVAAVSTADVVEAIQLSPAIMSAERDRSRVRAKVSPTTASAQTVSEYRVRSVRDRGTTRSFVRDPRGSRSSVATPASRWRGGCQVGDISGRRWAIRGTRRLMSSRSDR